MTAWRVRHAVSGDAGSIAHTHVLAWRQTYPGIVPAVTLAKLSVENRTLFWRRVLEIPEPRTRVFVGEDGTGTIVGFGVCGPERVGLRDYQGEFHAIYLVRAAQGRGLGSRLMGTMARAMLDQGMAAASVWVLRDNRRARRFYQGLGGQPVAERPLNFDGTEVTEVSYGWRDLPRFPSGRQP
ncbi:MAG TPA: GNAT family N-acetyltransferase [Azospirillaceae bacterium]|nr:GNAT family N-acetyltransferase [Azospirillaceae bacterium]